MPLTIREMMRTTRPATVSIVEEGTVVVGEMEAAAGAGETENRGSKKPRPVSGSAVSLGREV